MTKFYYFSGTGNTLWSAQTMARAIGGDYELHNIGVEAYRDAITIEADAVVLLFPSYAFGAPLIVRRFVKKTVFKTPYIACFVTYGSSPGGTLAEVGRIFKRKRQVCSFYGRIPAVENYLAIFGPPKTETAARRLAMQQAATGEAARSVAERRINRINFFRPFSSLVSLLFSLGVRMFYRWYTVSADCNGCGLCKKVCPVSAITMDNSRPVFSRRCEHCQGCLNWCPRQAINFGRLKSGIQRYHHPEISFSDITR